MADLWTDENACEGCRRLSLVAVALEEDLAAAEADAERRKEETERLAAFGRAKNQGAWFVYSWDCSAYPIALFGDELEARRFVGRQGYGDVLWWPFGTEFGPTESAARNAPAGPPSLPLWDDACEGSELPERVEL